MAGCVDSLKLFLIIISIIYVCICVFTHILMCLGETLIQYLNPILACPGSIGTCLYGLVHFKCDVNFNWLILQEWYENSFDKVKMVYITAYYKPSYYYCDYTFTVIMHDPYVIIYSIAMITGCWHLMALKTIFIQCQLPTRSLNDDMAGLCFVIHTATKSINDALDDTYRSKQWTKEIPFDLCCHPICR
jgi:hypothetical protein